MTNDDEQLTRMVLEGLSDVAGGVLPGARTVIFVFDERGAAVAIKGFESEQVAFGAVMDVMVQHAANELRAAGIDLPVRGNG